MTQGHLLVSSRRDVLLGVVIWILSFFFVGISILVLLSSRVWYEMVIFSLWPFIGLYALFKYYRRMRSIDVFDDRIEFHYKCNKELDYALSIKDIDSYIIDSYEVETKIGSQVCYRYFLKKDNRLYFYFYGKTYRNEDELLAVLNETFNLPFEETWLDISPIEMKMAERGEFITLAE